MSQAESSIPLSTSQPNSIRRFSVGIDLGTTNCVLSYVDLQVDESDSLNSEEPAVNVLAIPQLTTPGSVESKLQLPSFLYQPHESELSPDDIAFAQSTYPRTETAGPYGTLSGTVQLDGAAAPLRYFEQGVVEFTANKPFDNAMIIDAERGSEAPATLLHPPRRNTRCPTQRRASRAGGLPWPGRVG